MCWSDYAGGTAQPFWRVLLAAEKRGSDYSGVPRKSNHCKGGTGGTGGTAPEVLREYEHQVLHPGRA